MPTWIQWLHSGSEAASSALRRPHKGLEEARQQVLALLDDCDGVETDRLRWRLHTAESPQDLWMLRGAIFQVVASQHCQSLAADRINGLLPAFREILPQARVARI